MVKVSVCIEVFYTNLPFAERIRRCAQLGIPAIEFWKWDTPEKDLGRLKEILDETGVKVSTFCANLLDEWPDGDVGGSLVKPQERNVFIKRLEETMIVAKKLGAPNVIVLSGNRYPMLTDFEQERTMVEGLREGVRIAEAEGVGLLLEPLNTLVDHNGYFLDSSKRGFDIVRQIDSPKLKILYDVYHMQLMEGNIISTIEENIRWIGHFHIAGVPGRHEPGTGELNYSHICEIIDQLSYDGYVGLEYMPELDFEESLVNTLRVLGCD